MKKRWDILMVLVLMLVIFLVGFISIILYANKTKQNKKETPVIEVTEKINEEKRIEEEQIEEKELEELRKSQMSQTETEEKKKEEQVSNEVVLHYELENEEMKDAQALLKEQEEKLTFFLLAKLSGNGVVEETEAKKKYDITVKEISDQQMYLFFTCNLEGTDVSIIYYKDTGIFAIREENTQPGRTNNYQEVN